MRPVSISRRLSLSLLVVGIVGLVVLLGFILLDYHITFSALNEEKALHRALHEVAAHVLLPALVVTIPMGLAAFMVVRHALEPIHNIADEVVRTTSQGSGSRIASERLPEEIAPLADGFNRVLARLEDLSDRNAAFAADVAHELRTPLTVLSLELESLKGEEMEPLRAQVEGMRKLVEQLMMIARLDMAAEHDAPLDKLDLHALARRVVARMAPAALNSGRSLEVVNLEGATIRAEPESLGAALRNLIENALRVTPPGGTISVIVGPGARLAVADGGPGLSDDDLARLSLRHARADHASNSGAGLGLAIVRKIVEANGGVLSSDQALRRLTIAFAP